MHPIDAGGVISFLEPKLGQLLTFRVPQVLNIDKYKRDC